MTSTTHTCVHINIYLLTDQQKNYELFCKIKSRSFLVTSCICKEILLLVLFCSVLDSKKFSSNHSKKYAHIDGGDESVFGLILNHWSIDENVKAQKANAGCKHCTEY